MLLKYIDEQKNFVKYEYNEEENYFLIYDDEHLEYLCYYPENNLVSEYLEKDYELVYLFNNRNECTENSIHQVFVEKVRIGWIFPLQALLSKEHECYENQHFLKYAYVATCHILNQIHKDVRGQLPEEVRLEDFFEEYANFLVIDKSNCARIKDFSLDNYVVSLYKYGYSFSKEGNIFSDVEGISKNVNLKKMSEELCDVKYISTLFKEIFPIKQEAYSMFYTYYQVIEILISKVFGKEFTKIMKDLEADVDNLFDKRDSLSDLVNEKNRVRILFSNYVNIEAQKSKNLDALCIKLLEKKNKKIGKTVAENLYAVRCLLVHNMYTLDRESSNILKEINSAFLDNIMDMLLSYKSPT